MKGFLGGVSIGALVAVGGAAMWSLSSPLPSRVQVDTTTPDQSSQPEVAEAEAPQTNETRDADLVEAAPAIPSSSSDVDTSPIAVLDTSPGSRPVVANAEGASAGDMSPGVVETLPQVPSSVTVTPESSPAPSVPGQEETPVVSTEAAALPAPPPTAEQDPAEGAATSADPTSTDVATDSSDADLNTDEDFTVAQSVDSGDTLSEEVASVAVPQVFTPAVSALPGVDISGPEIGSAPVATQPPSISVNTAASPQSDVGAQSTSEENTGTEVAPEEDTVATAEQVDLEPQSDQEQLAAAETTTSGSRLGTRVVPLTERSNTPTLIGSDVASAPEAVAPTGQPIDINAEAFSAPNDRPLMSIVLIDDAAAIGAEALEGFPYPLTFAISPQDPKAAEKMQARRAAGFEVLILADLPREASPQDAETAMAVWIEQLPQAVGFLEGVDTGFQGNRPLADQMVAVMQASGYGMVTQNSGLNTVQKLALRDGMPSGVVFRDFDGAGQNPRAIRRFLDQAAFRARQEGAVIMLGRLRPDTISALLLWGLQDRASQVGLAPISAGLKANIPSAD
ncbi:divergent polysaccharide deacetylase family protein [Pseudophaeobacter sp.]|uniref:divergent polysaccharide deacetylase family protein n=1 Tax=Pseudophaeobacter sp. TaxID=1971739 RepID=UPI00329A4B7F